MKKLFNLAAIAALTLGLASCSKDVDYGMDGETGAAAFQFSLKTSQGALVTRADIATAPEWTVDDVNIYVFEASSKALIGTNSDFTYSSPTGEAVLTATDAWLKTYQGKAINVYFVGNKGANAINATSHVALSSFSGDEDAFKELVTDAQVVNTTAAKLTTPLLFSAYTTSSVTVPSVGKVTVPVSLKRREARFDIVNPIPTNFVVKEVVIKNANIQGYIFGANSGNATLTAANIEKIATTLTYDAEDLAASVFYLYPTTLGYGQDTEISIIAEVNGGAATAFPVKSNATIEANKRYKLSLNPATLEFDVTVGDYDKGDDYPIVTIDALTMSGVQTTGAATFDATNSIVTVPSSASASTVTLNVFASTAAGVTVNCNHVAGASGATAVSSTESTVTYSNIGYKTTVTISIPAHDGSKSFQTNVTIADNANPKATAELKVMFGAITIGEDGTIAGMDDVLVQWIRDNVKPSGVITPEDLAKVKEIDLSSEDGTGALKSLDGIEKFPNLKELNVSGNADLTGVVDLSKNPELEIVDLTGCSNVTGLVLDNPNLKEISVQGTSVEEIDLSKIPNLEKLNVTETPIRSVDFSLVPDLTSAAAAVCPNLTIIDISKNSKLDHVYFAKNENLEEVILPSGRNEAFDYLVVSDCPKLLSINTDVIANYPKLTRLSLTNLKIITSIDISQNTLLEVALLGGTMLTELDIRNNKALKQLYLVEIEHTVTLFVWDGFDKANPKNSISDYKVWETPIAWGN